MNFDAMEDICSSNNNYYAMKNCEYAMAEPEGDLL